jgi:hypothetical protein
MLLQKFDCRIDAPRFSFAFRFLKNLCVHDRTGPEDSNWSKIDLFRLVWMMLWWLKGVEEKFVRCKLWGGANSRTRHYTSSAGRLRGHCDELRE